LAIEGYDSADDGSSSKDSFLENQDQAVMANQYKLLTSIKDQLDAYVEWFPAFVRNDDNWV
jgi:hypothetical protein